MLLTGDRVSTEFGLGVIGETSARRVMVLLDSGEALNVSTGTPGYFRLVKIGA